MGSDAWNMAFDVHSMKHSSGKPLTMKSRLVTEPSSAKETRGTESEVLLRVEGLKKSFGGTSVLNKLDICLRSGEVVLLQGANGSGKTTLLNMLTGFLEPDAGKIQYQTNGTTTEFTFPRTWWQKINPAADFGPEALAGLSTGRTWQDIRLFGTQSLRNNIAVAAPNQPGENPFLALTFPRCKTRESTVRSAADAQLADLGLGGREQSSADKISLGQSKRVAIARAVMAGARLLFLDEPLAGLDRTGIEAVVDLLRFLVQDKGITLVIVEHIFNQRHLSGLCTTEWSLEDGRLVTRDIQLSRRTVPSNAARPMWLASFARGETKIEDQYLPNGAVLTRITTGERSASEPILRLRNVSIVRGERIVVGSAESGGVSLDLYRNEVAVLQAPNGWGKSSLLNAITGLLPADGEVIFCDHAITNEPTWVRANRGISYLPSNRPYFDQLSAEENFHLARSVSRSELPSGPISQMSGGQRQRLALQAMFESRRQHQLLMFDEPFLGLDESATLEACRSISTLSAGRACIISVPLS